MFPNADYRNSSRSQSRRCGTITLLVAIDLGRPEFGTCLRNVTAVSTAMPEATIHEQSELTAWKEKVGSSGQRLMEFPARDFSSYKG
jgi:hypothetical protein